MNAAMLSPEFDGPGAALRRRLAGFLHTLRDNGFSIGLAESTDAARLLTSRVAERPETLRAAFRALFCARQADLARFDELFMAYWFGRGVRTAARVSGHSSGAPTLQRMFGPAGRETGSSGLPDHTTRTEGADIEALADGRGRKGGASMHEALAAKDLRHIADRSELEAAHALAEKLARRMRVQLTRRARLRTKGERLDLRRTIHRNISHGGDLIDLAWRRRKSKPLRLVILLDASGSMELYTSFFLRFIHGVAAAFLHSEVFLFHTRLVHVSEALRDRNALRAVERLSLLVQGIGSGTKIGESLAAFNRWHARRVLHSYSCVMIMSDGYDTGDPALLAAAMHSLRRRCRRIVWLNPLIGWEGYAPTARGIQAALPYIDFFAPAHNLESLAALEPYLARI
ncbi:MAG: vWA domain-containing protein [Beijerinckiaceae bacterium]